MLAKGWFIVHESIDKKKIIYCFIYSIFLALPQITFQTNFINKALGTILIKNKKNEQCLDQEISNEIDFGYRNNFRYFSISKILSDSSTPECSDIIIWTAKSGWSFAFILIGFIGVIFYYKDLITSIESSSEYVIAHLMVINESGIDPITTPIMTKYVIYKYLSWGIMIYLGAQQFVMLITQFLENYVAFWVQQLFIDIVNLFGIIGAAFILKLNKNRLNGFMQLPSNSNESENEIEADSINNNNDQNQFNDNLFFSNLEEAQSIEISLNENNNDNGNVYSHNAQTKMNKRVVSRDEIKKFIICIENRSRMNSNFEENSNHNNSFDTELNNQDSNAGATNENGPRMVKWEEWMTLPPQPIISDSQRTRIGSNNSYNENQQDGV